jgi:pimeloyl-ACP methyl ester carboxylesterase
MSMLRRADTELYYELTGQGTPVLFIQGVGVHGGGWKPQVDALAQNHQCLTFDNRGMGRSQPMGGPLSIELMAEDALALMAAVGWDSAHVVGHSMGGLIAQHLALTVPKRVRSLSLLCTIPRGRDATTPTPWIIWVGLRSNVGTKRSRRHAFLEMVMSPMDHAKADLDAVAAQYEPLFGHDLAVQPPVAMKQLSAMGKYDATPRLGEVAGIPTLVVSAAHDRIAPPKSGRALAAGIPGARYVELPAVSHGVPIQYPEKINPLLLQHFASAK